MTLQAVPATPDADGTAFIAEAHQQLEQLEARLGALWSTQLSVDPIVADQIAVSTRYIRMAAAALSEPRLA